MNKEVPKSAIDYSGGQKDAAYTVLGEIVNLLVPFADDVRIVGGWVPSLLYPDKEHVGSIDVDVLLNQLNIRRKDGYTTIQKVLLNNGYHRHPSQFFTFTKTIIISSVPYTVDVDFLAGMYGGKDGSVSKHVNGIKALRATGGNFAFEFPPEDVRIEYQRADGAKDIGHVKVVSVIPSIVMKVEAMGRGKSKDAYDIYFCLRYYSGGIRALADSFQIYKDRPIIKRMCQKLSEKFASPDYAGPSDIVSFMGIENVEEIARVRQDAYQRVKYLVDALKTMKELLSRTLKCPNLLHKLSHSIKSCIFHYEFEFIHPFDDGNDAGLSSVNSKLPLSDSLNLLLSCYDITAVGPVH